jgi:hypothetical protein
MQPNRLRTKLTTWRIKTDPRRFRISSSVCGLIRGVGEGLRSLVAKVEIFGSRGPLFAGVALRDEFPHGVRLARGKRDYDIRDRRHNVTLSLNEKQLCSRA